jgi:hypothetical protein
MNALAVFIWFVGFHTRENASVEFGDVGAHLFARRPTWRHLKHFEASGVSSLINEEIPP